jgi:hypothetical protein
MQSELEKVTAEIEEATRCMGDGLDERAADHLAAASALLDALITTGPSTSSKSASPEPPVLRRRVAA